MAQNDIVVRFRIDQDGSLKQIQQNAKGAADSIDGLDRSGARYNSTQKSLYQGTLASSKAFSKQKQAIGGSSGVVGAYATLAANIFAITAAFGALQRAAQFNQLVEGFERTANTVGRTSSIIVGSLKDITDNAISTEQAYRAAAQGFNAGFSTLEIEGLTRVAKGASLALGRDLGDALDRLIRGTAKLEPEILDELGIFVRLDDAAKDYANSLGKASTELTDAERRQAFLNATLTQGQLKFAGIAEAIEVNPYDKLSAAFSKLTQTGLSLVNTFLVPIASVLSTNITALLGILVLFSSTIASQMFPVLNKLGEKFELAANKQKKLVAEGLEYREDIIGTSIAKVSELGSGSKGKVFDKLQTALIEEEKVSVKELEKTYESLQESIIQREKNILDLTDKKLDKKQKELDLITEQAEAVRELIEAEREGSKVERSVKGAERLGETEGKVGQALELIQSGELGVVGGFTEAWEGVKKYREELPRTIALMLQSSSVSGTWGRRLTILSGRLRLGSAAVRLFGAAFINALPVIGQIIFAIGLVVQGLTTLVQWINKPSEAMQEMITVIEGLDEKMKQLSDTNSKLENKFYSVLIAQEKTKVGIKGITEETARQAAETAKSYAEVEAYANTLQVAAGVSTEFASALSKLADEIANEDAPLLGQISSFIANSTIMVAFSRYIDSFTESLKRMKEQIMDSAFVQELVFIGSFFAEIGGAIAEGAASFSRWIGLTDVVENIGKSWDKSAIDAKINKFTDESIDRFNELKDKAPEVGDIIERELGSSLEVFMNNAFKGVRAAKDLEEGNNLLSLAMTQVTGALEAASRQVNQSSEGIQKLGENFAAGAIKVRKFSADFFKKNEFETLGESVQTSVNAIKALQDAADSSAGQLDFATALAKELASGGLDLEAFGVTLEEVQKKGVEAFAPLQEAISFAGAEADIAKNKIAGLKSELVDSQKVFQNTIAVDTLERQLKGLKATGTFQELAGDVLASNKKIYDDRIKQINNEAKLKKDIIDQEFSLEMLKLDILALQNKGNTALLNKITAMRTQIEATIAASKSVVTTEAEGEQTAAGSEYFSREASGLQGILSSISGDSTQEVISSIITQLGDLKGVGSEVFNILDQEGNVVFTNFAAQAQLVTAALSPMIEKFKELGPEGQVAAAIGQTMLNLNTSIMSLKTSISESLGVGAVNSFSALSEAWNDSATTMEDKASVLASAFGAVAGVISGIASIMRESANQTIAHIDRQIEAEKKRDGTSAASQQKLAQLEKKKEQVKRKAFETDKKLRTAEAVMSTAAGIAAALAGGPLTMWLAPIIGAMGAAQIAIISGMTYDGGGSKASAPSSIAIGNRQNTVDLAKARSPSGELAYARGEQGIGEGMTNYKPTPAFTGTRYRAGGGNTAFMVGEQGPEMFVPDRPGRIVPADETQGFTGQPMNVNFSISAVDAAGIEELLIAQRGNLIGMIREAANSHGETFLESVNTRDLEY